MNDLSMLQSGLPLRSPSRSMGVKLIDLKGTEKLTAIAPVVSQDEEEEAEGGTPTPSML